MNIWLFLLVLVGIFLAGNWWFRYRTVRIAKARSGQGFEEFAAYFSADRIPLYKLRDAYEYFQNLQPVKDFPVHPDDDLCKDYGLCDEDFDDAVLELAKQWRTRSPAASDVEGHPPIRTVADVLRLLSRLPQEENPHRDL